VLSVRSNDNEDFGTAYLCKPRTKSESKRVGSFDSLKPNQSKCMRGSKKQTQKEEKTKDPYKCSVKKQDARLSSPIQVELFTTSKIKASFIDSQIYAQFEGPQLQDHSAAS
jgi:hypothetical protein